MAGNPALLGYTSEVGLCVCASLFSVLIFFFLPLVCFVGLAA